MLRVPTEIRNLAEVQQFIFVCPKALNVYNFSISFVSYRKDEDLFILTKIFLLHRLFSNLHT